MEKVFHGCGRAGVFGVITLVLFLLQSGTVSALTPGELPKGGTITAGSGSISTHGKDMTVNQSTPKMIATWTSFNIGRNAGVTFVQPDSSAIALNRIYDENPSEIFGTLSANGKIFLINPSGIVFGAGAQVNVGGMVASSLNMLDSDFLAGQYIFFKDGNAGNILNQGNISGGVVALIAPIATNEGTITANGGSVVLGAGNQVTLDFIGDGLISYTIDQGAVDALAENKGLIKADGGLVVMTAKAADSLTQAVVNNSGVIEAQTVLENSGRILLISDTVNGTTIVSGTLDASAPADGDGGFIETSAASVKVTDGTIVTTMAPSGTIGTWNIDPVDFTVAASGDITGAQLSTNLGTTNVNILSSGGATGTEGNVNINDNVSWSANNILGLSAYKDVNINTNITATGNTAGMVITPNTGSVGGDYYLNNGAVITLSGLTPSLTISGNAYTVINEANGGVTTLQNMNSNLTGYYALGTNIDATATSTWNGGLGFVPVGNSTTQFTGKFEGLNHTISSLYITRPSENFVGLFGYIGSGSSVRNVGLVDGSASGFIVVGGLAGANFGTIKNSYAMGSASGRYNVGVLAGYNFGTIENSYATGSTSGMVNVGSLVGYNGGTVKSSCATGSVTGDYYVGMLVGYNDGTVENSYATGNVSGGVVVVGGLIGYNGGTVENSYATSSVDGRYNVGGLAGYNFGTVENSYATGSTSGMANVGGLAGYNYNFGTIENSHATGSVTGNYYAGGLAGYNEGSIENSYATGNVSGVVVGGGGLAGYNGGIVQKSYATGGVSGNYYIGGLAGYNRGTVQNSYAAGSVNGSYYIGGLAGYNGGIVEKSYAAGLVNNGVAGTTVGGLVGYSSGSATNSFWNTVTTGQIISAGGTASDTTNMNTYALTNGLYSSWDTGIWNIEDGSYPTLK